MVSTAASVPGTQVQFRNFNYIDILEKLGTLCLGEEKVERRVDRGVQCPEGSGQRR